MVKVTHVNGIDLPNLFMFNNPFKPNEISHSYQFDQSISVLRAVWWYFSFLFKCKYSIQLANSVDPEQTFCGVWSGSALFAHLPQKGC